MKLMTRMLMALWVAMAAAEAGDTTEREARIAGDLAAVRIYREGLAATWQYVESRPELFSARKVAEQRLLNREQREAVWTTWKTFLDYVVALDAVGKANLDCWRLRAPARHRAFQAGYAAFLAQYRYATDFVQRAGNDPWLDVLLNEPVPEIGLPKNTYAKLRDRFLNAARGAEFAALDAAYKSLADDTPTEVRRGLEEDRQVLWKLGRGKGQVLAVKNSFDFVRRAGFTVYLPVQTGISEWMGDTKVARKERSLITADQIATLPARLEPGDVLLERREWYLSNVGLPGFWPHAALYVGTAEERRKYFGDGIEKQLAATGKTYELSGQAQEHGHLPRVLEAMSEGVVFTTIEHSAACDSLAVLRPRLTKDQKAAALVRAFRYQGRPYDFNFDFRTDAALVCTELVYKGYEPTLKFALVEMLGRPVLPANDIVKQFDANYGSQDQQFDLVLFLDGHEGRQRAEPAGVDEFRRSCQRPKWHIVTQQVNFRAK
jgi:hypothetical protein